MNRALSFMLALTVAAPLSLPKANATPQKGKSPLVHFVVINMSGAARELHHRGDRVPLPIAVLVSLQVPAGDNIEITSSTNNKVEDVIAIAATDEGRTIPISMTRAESARVVSNNRGELGMINGMSRSSGRERLFPMKKTTDDLIAEVPCRRSRIGMTIGIDLGDVWRLRADFGRKGRPINGSIDSPLEPQPHRACMMKSSSRVRIETRWRATCLATEPTTKAKTL